MKTPRLPEAWETTLANELKNLKAWYVSQKTTMTPRLWQSLYKEIFYLWRKHAPDPDYNTYDFFYVLHAADKEGVWNLDRYTPGTKDTSFNVIQDYCGVLPINELDSHKFYRYERVGACPFQLASKHHHNLMAKLLKPENKGTSFAIVLRTPESKPRERAFKNGVVPKDYFELIPFICAIKPW